MNGQVSRAADKALALLLPDTGPRSREISTLCTFQDTENECETEQCGVDMSHKCGRAEETEQWLIEDYMRLQLFRDANVSDDAISALKHFRCDACDCLKQPPSKRKVAVHHAETLNDIVSMDVNFWKITFRESPRVKTALKVLNIVDAASSLQIAIQIADKTAETIWRAFATGWLRWAGSPKMSSS